MRPWHNNEMSIGRVVDLRKGGSAPRRKPTRPHPERERRIPLRVQRRKRRIVTAVASVLFVAVMAYAVHLISYAPRLTIQSITVQGTQYVPADLVLSYVESVLDDGSYHFLARDNIAVYPKDVIEAGIVRDFPRIKTASVGRASTFSNALVVSVAERAPFARWCAAPSGSSTACFLMDETGFVFSEHGPFDPKPNEQYVFSGGFDTDNPIGRTFEPDHLSGIVSLLAKLREARFAPLGVVKERADDLSIPLEQGFALKATYGSDPERVVRDLELVLASEVLRGKVDELEYVDLRFGNRVYYKLKGEAIVQ